MAVEMTIGSVIRLRNRTWRVDRLDDREFWAIPLDGRDTRRWRFSRSLEEGGVRPAKLAVQHGRQPRQQLPVADGAVTECPAGPLPGQALLNDRVAIAVADVIEIGEPKPESLTKNQQPCHDEKQTHRRHLASFARASGGPLRFGRVHYCQQLCRPVTGYSNPFVVR